MHNSSPCKKSRPVQNTMVPSDLMCLITALSTPWQLWLNIEGKPYTAELPCTLVRKAFVRMTPTVSKPHGSPNSAGNHSSSKLLNAVSTTSTANDPLCRPSARHAKRRRARLDRWHAPLSAATNASPEFSAHAIGHAASRTSPACICRVASKPRLRHTSSPTQPTPTGPAYSAVNGRAETHAAQCAGMGNSAWSSDIQRAPLSERVGDSSVFRASMCCDAGLCCYNGWV
mmetsp:Transcript_81236/g.263362  ORF Transcript_81236/g.263362 Transcript_81236/m.263362 type:complete len:229 (-) Transcript_81236:12-698(-)